MDFAFPPIAPQPTPERAAERTPDAAEGASDRQAPDQRDGEDGAGREPAFAAHVERALAQTAPPTQAKAGPIAGGQALVPTMTTNPPTPQGEAAPVAQHDAPAGKTNAAPTDKTAPAPPPATAAESAQPATPALAAGQTVGEPTLAASAEKTSAQAEIAPANSPHPAAAAPAAAAAPTPAKAIDPQADKSPQTPAPLRASTAAAPAAPAAADAAEQTQPTSQPQIDFVRAAAPAAAQADHAPLRAGRDESAGRTAAVEPSGKSKSAGAPAAPENAPSAPHAARAAQGDARTAHASPPAPAPGGDTAATTSAPAPAHSAAAAVHDAQRAIEAANGAPRASAPAAQVAQQIVRRIANGATTFEMQLDPPELGRVEVKLEMSRDHRVSALIAAEDPATLSQIARAAREIETMLEAAGLQLDDRGLSFDLADRQSAERGAQGDRGSAAGLRTNDETAAEATPQRALLLERWRGARVDLVA